MSAIKKFHAPERKFERGFGCYSCKSWNNGELSRKHWESCRQRDLAHIAATPGVSRLGELENAIPDQRDARIDQLKFMDENVSRGAVGICMKGARPASLGGPEGDFVAYSFACDRWVGRDGSSLASAPGEKKLLNEEMQQEAEERIRKGSK
jgi:hypothetical protein